MIRKELDEPKWKKWAFLALYIFIPLAAFLTSQIAYWPGLITADSGYQWEMAKGLQQMNAVHPVAHTILIKLLLKIWDNPAIISLFGVIFMSVAFGFCLFVLDLKRVNRILLILAAFIFALSPNNLVLSITMWKDIPYTAALIVSTGLMMYIATFNKKNAANNSRLLTLSLYSASIFLNLCWVFRYNGEAVSIGGLFLLIIFMRKESIIKKIVPVILSGLLIGVFANYILPPLVNSLPNAYDYTGKYIARQVIGADLQYNALTADNSDKLWEIFDKSKVKQKYIPEDFSPILWDDELWANYNDSPTAKKDLQDIFFATLKQKPYTMFENAMSSSNLVWGISKPDKVQSGDFAEWTSDEYNPMKIVRTENTLSKAISKYVKYSQTIILFSFFWKNGLWLLITMILFVFLLDWKKFRSIYVFFPALLSTASCMIAITAEYRYVWPLYAITPILIIYFLYELFIEGKQEVAK
ncbi:MAG: DUF6020 family protein [Bacillota bacterium]|nr:DUF6020 family protein [Bacillota bacterium]